MTMTVLTVLAVSAVVAVPVVTTTPLKLNPPFSVIRTISETSSEGDTNW